MQQIPILTLPALATAAVAASRFVGFNGQHAAAGAIALGVSEYAAAIGEMFPANVLGTAKVEVSAAVEPGGLIQVGANGLGAPLTTGKAVARVFSGTAGAGVAEVILLPSSAA